MSLNVGKLVSKLMCMTINELQRKYDEVYGGNTQSHHKSFLIRRIAWQLQALEGGGLSAEARRRALDFAVDTNIRTRSNGRPPTRISRKTISPEMTTTKTIHVQVDSRLPMPGALLIRQYRGRTIQVRVLPNGFDYNGEVYRSLTAVAKAVTGGHWNGFHFFGIKSPNEKTAVNK